MVFGAKNLYKKLIKDLNFSIMKKICRILETKIKISKVRPKFRTEKIGREIKKIINYFFIIKRRQKAATSIFDIGFGSDFLVVFASPSAEVIKKLGWVRFWFHIFAEKRQIIFVFEFLQTSSDAPKRLETLFKSKK